MEDFDLELDKMELVAAAAGYYYYNSITRQPRHSSLPYGSSFMSEVLNGPDDGCQEMFRMDKHVFHNLCGILRQRGMLRDTAGVMIEEQLSIFLNIIGHNERKRVIQERFQHSGETISRHFNNVLKAIKSLSCEFLQPPPIATPPEIVSSNRFYPYFKDCIGVIDGMRVPAHLLAKDQSRFRNKKGVLSQNVLAACTFDLQFIFMYPGWEGSAADSLKKCLQSRFVLISCLFHKVGGTIDLEPCLTHTSAAEPTLAPVAVERAMTTRADQVNHRRAQSSVCFGNKLCTIPFLLTVVSKMFNASVKSTSIKINSLIK
ncbi:nuclease HARBI [Salix suchowensis]|nr:nuclease HARBI [Salix suchowensis]